jgi:hypothetical protein
VELPLRLERPPVLIQLGGQEQGGNHATIHKHWRGQV